MESPQAKNDKWLKFVKQNLKNYGPEASVTDSDRFIFGIAHPVLTQMPEAYFPQVVSIGPYHHGRLQQYEEIDNYKLKMAIALDRVIEFTTVVEYIQPFIAQIRAYYDRHIPYSGEMLSWMLARDTIFILQFLKSSYTNNVENETPLRELDAILDSKRNTPLWYAIKNDRLMLENQVPMLLLTGVVKFLSDQVTQAASSSQREEIERFQESNNPAVMLEKAYRRFNPFTESPQSPELGDTKHVLDYLYQYVTAPFTSEPETENKHRAGGNLPSATELSEAGIEFAPCNWKVEFHRTTSTFLLPKITINDSTEVLLRNLVALELNLKIEQKPLARYTYLMDRLIDTKRDVAVLKTCAVLNSQMGSDAEVTKMWNSMGKSTWEHTFAPIDNAIEKANKYYRNKWNVLLAEFLKSHCSKPWVVVSVLSAGILLSLTAIQVLCLFITCNK